MLAETDPASQLCAHYPGGSMIWTHLQQQVRDVHSVIGIKYAWSPNVWMERWWLRSARQRDRPLHALTFMRGTNQWRLLGDILSCHLPSYSSLGLFLRFCIEKHIISFWNASHFASLFWFVTNRQWLCFLRAPRHVWDVYELLAVPPKRDFPS